MKWTLNGRYDIMSTDWNKRGLHCNAKRYFVLIYILQWVRTIKWPPLSMRWYSGTGQFDPFACNSPICAPNHGCKQAAASSEHGRIDTMNSISCSAGRPQVLNNNVKLYVRKTAPPTGCHKLINTGMQAHPDGRLHNFCLFFVIYLKCKNQYVNLYLYFKLKFMQTFASHGMRTAGHSVHDDADAHHKYGSCIRILILSKGFSILVCVFLPLSLSLSWFSFRAHPFRMPLQVTRAQIRSSISLWEGNASSIEQNGWMPHNGRLWVLWQWW